MKPGRNQLCPCGSGLKFKKCCLAKEPLDAADSSLSSNAAIPSAIVDDVVNTISSLPDDKLVERLNVLADCQPNLCGFVTPLSSSLPDNSRFPAALSAFAIIWMFEQYHQAPLPKIGFTAIKRTLERNAKSFFKVHDLAAMAGKHQPAVHRFIADTILDLEADNLDGVELFNLFLMLKTIVDVLHEALSHRAMPNAAFLQPVGAF